MKIYVIVKVENEVKTVLFGNMVLTDKSQAEELFRLYGELYSGQGVVTQLHELEV